MIGRFLLRREQRRTALERRESKKNKIEENKKQSTGMFSKLFGIKKTEIDSYNFTREEEEKIRNILFSMDLDMPKWKIDEMFKNLI